MRVRVLCVLAILAAATCARAPMPPGGLAPQAGVAAQEGPPLRLGPPARPGIDGPLAQAGADLPAQPFTGAAPVVATTSDLMDRAARRPARNAEGRPRLRKIGPDWSQLQDDPESPRTSRWPTRGALGPVLDEAAPLAAVAADTPNTEIVHSGETPLTPPDTMGDVGPTQYLTVLNGRMKTISKATGLPDGVISLHPDDFFPGDLTGQAVRFGEPTGDPRVRYDRRTGRWFVLAFTFAVPNRYVLAVSDGAVITGATVWTFHGWANTRTQGGVGGAAGCLGDHPTLGIDEDALYVGVNQFCGGTQFTVTFDSTSAYVVRKSALPGALVVSAFDALLTTGAPAGPYTPQGVDSWDDGTSTGYFIGIDLAQAGRLMLRRVSNPGGTPSLSGNVAIGAAQGVPSTTSPIDVPQPGVPQTLSGIDGRLMQAVIRNGRLWTVHHIQVDADGVASASGGRNGQRWYELQDLGTTPGAPAPAVRQSGTVFDAAPSQPLSYWMGALNVNGQGHVALGMSRSGASPGASPSTTGHANAAVTGRLAGDPLGTMDTPEVYTANTSFTLTSTPQEGSAGPFRWGDYSYTSVDPDDDQTMWTLQQYVSDDNRWAVRLVRLLAPPPAAITSVSPTSLTTGQTGVTLTVTGASSGGSGFFDPGPGFARRLAASFDGAGITVTDVAFASPTQITLTVDVTGAVAGARALTVTNPDGQVATLDAAVTIANSPPSAVEDAYQTPFGTPLSVPPPGVLANDSDANGDTLTAQLVSGPSTGSVTLGANGSFTYTPAAGFSGAASFTYRAFDGTAQGNSATVSLTVLPNTPPVAAADAYDVGQGQTLTVPAPGVLGNDTDVDGQPLSAVLAAGPSSGSLLLDASGGFSFTPAAGFVGPTVFTYRASDGGAQSETAAVTLLVSANAFPVVTAPGPQTLVDEGGGVTLGPLAFTASDPDGQPLVVTASSSNPAVVATAGLVLGGSGASRTLTVTSAPGSPGGTTTIALSASDGITTTTASFQLTILPRRGPPSGLAAVVARHTVSFAWAPPPVSLETVTGYLLEAGFAPGATDITIPLGLLPRFSVSAPAGVYFVRVRTRTSGGTSLPSNEVRIATGQAAPPSAPGGLLATVQGLNVTLQWTENPLGPVITSYLLQAGTASGATDLAVLPLPASARGFSANVAPGTYFVRVAAANAAGAGPPSNEAVLTTGPGICTVPAVPAGLVATPTPGGVTLSWSPPAAGGIPVGYRLEAGTAPGASNLGVFALPDATAVAGSLAPGGYVVRLAATNGCGSSAVGPEVAFAVP